MQGPAFLQQMFSDFSSPCACRFCGHDTESQVRAVPQHQSSTSLLSSLIFIFLIAFLLFPVPLILFLGSILQPVLDVCVLPVLGTIPAPWSAAPSGDVPGVCTAVHCSLFPSVSLLPYSSAHSTTPSMAAPPGAVGEGNLAEQGTQAELSSLQLLFFFPPPSIFFFSFQCLPSESHGIVTNIPSLLIDGKPAGV